LEETTLIRGIDHWEEEREKVVLMTLHMAKGLEFNVVFIVGLEEGVLPHQFSLDDEDGLEEERRLFYVGITRARELLYLSRSSSRARAGSIQASPASRFLRELPQTLLQVDSHYRRTIWEGASEDSGDGTVLEYDEGVAPDFRPGDAVVHPYFGRGEILRVNGSGISARVRVRFHQLGEKLLLVKYAKLKKVL
jgi:DNA helicase-2/ATP-dependent DNA helicase PcrA